MFLLTGHNGKIEFSSVMKLTFLKFFQYVIGKYDGGLGISELFFLHEKIKQRLKDESFKIFMNMGRKLSRSKL